MCTLYRQLRVHRPLSKSLYVLCTIHHLYVSRGRVPLGTTGCRALSNSRLSISSLIVLSKEHNGESFRQRTAIILTFFAAVGETFTQTNGAQLLKEWVWVKVGQVVILCVAMLLQNAKIRQMIREKNHNLPQPN